MPVNEVSPTTPSTPVDRLALQIGSVRGTNAVGPSGATNNGYGPISLMCFDASDTAAPSTAQQNLTCTGYACFDASDE